MTDWKEVLRGLEKQAAELKAAITLGKASNLTMQELFPLRFALAKLRTRTAQVRHTLKRQLKT